MHNLGMTSHSNVLFLGNHGHPQPLITTEVKILEGNSFFKTALLQMQICNTLQKITKRQKSDNQRVPRKNFKGTVIRIKHWQI